MYINDIGVLPSFTPTVNLLSFAEAGYHVLVPNFHSLPSNLKTGSSEPSWKDKWTSWPHPPLRIWWFFIGKPIKINIIQGVGCCVSPSWHVFFWKKSGSTFIWGWCNAWIGLRWTEMKICFSWFWGRGPDCFSLKYVYKCLQSTHSSWRFQTKSFIFAGIRGASYLLTKSLGTYLSTSDDVSGVCISMFNETLAKRHAFWQLTCCKWS